MSQDKSPESISINSWLEDELYQQYLHDRRAVDESWSGVFQHRRPNEPGPANANGTITVSRIPAPPAGAVHGDPSPLRGAAARLAENMTASLSVPVASSQRIIAVKVIEENRRILNQHRTLTGKSKISFTHLVAWAIVKALGKYPNINCAYAEIDGQPHRLLRPAINLGIAVDVAGKDGNRALVVPSIKNTGALNFQEYMQAFDDLVVRARKSKLTPDDFAGTTISLTNPGTVGTFGSMPRLMAGQGAIIATGVIDYPAEYQGVSPSVRSMIGLSKVMAVSCTYDHRIIQGAESGVFLAHLQELLQGEHGFYESIFADLKLPYHPVKWQPDKIHLAGFGGHTGPSEEVAKHAAVLQLINAYRVRGHLIADLDPLGSEPQYHPELDPATYGLTIWDLDREFLTGTLGRCGVESGEMDVATLREILETLRGTYCGKIGCEYMNIQVPEQKRWLQQHMEPQANGWPLDHASRLRALQVLIEAEEFEHFLHSRFVGQKRFALEGSEAAMAILDGILSKAADQGVHEVVMGMAHRGRLTVLANLIGKPMEQIFSAFEGELDPEATQGSGDVKYHLGAAGIHLSPSGAEIKVVVSPNPSHLEAVNPVVVGIVRPKQDRIGDTKRDLIIPVLVHGDAAFAGQGVVAETLNLSQLEGYRTGGTIHLIINNQIGFTTNPYASRSTQYCTDVARTVQAPIFHINGDDPEACLRVAGMALEYRQTFDRDVVIDMFCYRRHGHNEGDDPSYTQPVMYRKIRQQPSVAKLYGEKLVREKAVTQEEIEKIRQTYIARLSAAFEVSKKAEYEIQEVTPLPWQPAQDANTAISQEVLEKVVRGITTLPEGFHLHPKLRGFQDKRRDILKGAPIDWAGAEAIAFGSLAIEGTPVRLSGQDSGRGTFSQRHLTLYDAETGEKHIPLQHLDPHQARFDVIDSSLSEFAVMGFEFGYSIGDPQSLVMWEGQFGDFANGAQVIIDQFICVAESKWGQPSGLVLLLPHGYEGQGPEHSSARLERFLQLCAENNMQVANCTLPAQYFHLLRRQMRGGPEGHSLRKPLAIFTPKSMLRHPKAVSYGADLMTGSFRELLPDTSGSPDGIVTRVVFCSGKLYWELAALREERKLLNVAILRIEQLYPFPTDQMEAELRRYAASASVVWAQEEPRNMGAWKFVQEHLDNALEPTRRRVRYVGRPESSSPATGSSKRHAQEQSELLEDAFAAQPVTRKRTRMVRKKAKPEPLTVTV
ncbi:MAG: multifunctional oxoglutarate decarboxylase/oxoglutarate dehydrogenase thiamine pyrophosphate-binding subunit/dihydrolipoyllysine-residue succinyltransferase subunit [Acidobacteria bacterium]|nr:multifunctional oxoglutarate decarboxylase/oxoglutarate dehydrogenase thiamine pyrophosphate-binding subunit/dihydrolipoyllysine-residue succinyltransferase subunit [Acidobacteriota bacterium]